MLPDKPESSSSSGALKVFDGIVAACEFLFAVKVPRL